MKRTPIKSLVAIAALSISSLVLAQTPAEKPDTPAPKPEKQAAAVEQNLHTFDTLDFDVFSSQKWDRLKESHSPDIVAPRVTIDVAFLELKNTGAAMKESIGTFRTIIQGPSSSSSVTT